MKHSVMTQRTKKTELTMLYPEKSGSKNKEELSLKKKLPALISKRAQKTKPP